MTNASLRLVEKENSLDKNKALDAAVSQIERAFGKGAIMRLGQEDVVDTELLLLGLVAFLKDESLKFMVQRVLARQL